MGAETIGTPEIESAPKSAAEFLAKELQAHKYGAVEIALAKNDDTGSLAGGPGEFMITPESLHVFSDGFVAFYETGFKEDDMKDWLNVHLTAGVGPFVYKSIYSKLKPQVQLTRT